MDFHVPDSPPPDGPPAPVSGGTPVGSPSRPRRVPPPQPAALLPRLPGSNGSQAKNASARKASRRSAITAFAAAITAIAFLIAFIRMFASGEGEFDWVSPPFALL